MEILASPVWGAVYSDVMEKTSFASWAISLLCKALMFMGNHLNMERGIFTLAYIVYNAFI